MNKSKANAVCRYILEKSREDVKWKLVLLSLSLLMFDGTYRINSFCSMVGTGITPWLLPHMLSAMPLQFTYILGYLLISCNLPYLSTDSTLALTRSGYRNWGRGVLKSIRVISLYYLLFFIILSIVFILPSLTIDVGWGKILHTFAETPRINTNYFRIFTISDRIISCYTPVEAMFWGIVLEYLCLNLLALIVLVVNLLSRANVGIYAALSVAALDFFVYNDLGDKAIFFSPVSLARLSVIDATQTSYYPSPIYAITFLVVSCITLHFTALRLFKRIRY